jgi:hypothetical protein
MPLRAAARLALILLPLTTTATRLHAHRVDAPDLATQEVNRCLNLIKIAASKRGDGRKLTRGDVSRPVAFRSRELPQHGVHERSRSLEAPAALDV